MYVICYDYVMTFKCKNYDLAYHIFDISSHKYEFLCHNVDIVCNSSENDVVCPEGVCVVELCLTEQSRNGGGVCGVIRAAGHAEINTLSLRYTHYLIDPVWN